MVVYLRASPSPRTPRPWTLTRGVFPGRKWRPILWMSDVHTEGAAMVNDDRLFTTRVALFARVGEVGVNRGLPAVPGPPLDLLPLEGERRAPRSRDAAAARASAPADAQSDPALARGSDRRFRARPPRPGSAANRGSAGLADVGLAEDLADRGLQGPYPPRQLSQSALADDPHSPSHLRIVRSHRQCLGRRATGPRSRVRLGGRRAGGGRVCGPGVVLGPRPVRRRRGRRATGRAGRDRFRGRRGREVAR